jgi:hypothetical protein
MTFIDETTLFREESAAIHEAGHIVIAQELNFPQGPCRLKHVPELDRWHGEVRAPNLNPLEFVLHSSQVAMIAMGGMFAQARYFAECHASEPAGIRKIGSTPYLMDFLRSKFRTEVDSGKIQIAFFAASIGEFELTFDGHIFSTSDCKTLHNAMSYYRGASEIELAEIVVGHVNGDGVWKSIHAVAAALMAAPVRDDNMRYLFEGDVERILANGTPPPA